MIVGRPVRRPIVPVTKGGETFRGPVIRQGFTSLRVRQGLRHGSGNLFDENHLGALKGSRFWCRYANCPQKGHVQTSTYQRATGNRFHCSSRWNGSTALARETRAELRISTFTPRQRPHEPRIPHELISHQQVNDAQGRSHGPAPLTSVARSPAKTLRPLGMRATAVPKKETFLDEMENRTGSASR